jgi:hypothetical protein
MEKNMINKEENKVLENIKAMSTLPKYINENL